MSPHITHLFSLLLAKGDGPRLADAVTRAESTMAAAGEIDLWRYWKGQALLAAGHLEEAAAYVQQIENIDQAEALESLVQRAIAAKSEDSTARVDLLERRFGTSGDPLDLFELCEAYYDAKDWPAITKHAKAILSGIGTAAALRLAVESAHRVGDFRLCLELLEGREGLFPSSCFPADLRRLRVLCWRKEGRLERAIPEAEALARETGDTSDVLTLVAVRLQSADPKRAVVEARELLKRSDLAAEDHLQLAHVFKVEDQSAAVAHLEKAMAAGNRSPEFVATALDLVFRLNREDKFVELQPALEHSASTGGAIQLAGPERVIEMIRSGAENQQQVQALYDEGRIPLHWALELFRGTLGQAYEQRFNPAARAIHSASPRPLFIRHGGRTAPGPRGIKKLYVDISSLLIAAQLDLCDAVEQAFGPIYLPPSVVPALYLEIAETQSHQPSKLEEARLIVSLVVHEKLRIAPVSLAIPKREVGEPSADWLALLKAAQDSAGYVVTYLPLSRGFPPTAVTLTDNESRLVTDCAALLLSLQSMGKLTATEYETATRDLGGLAIKLSSHIPQLGSSLYLHGNIVGVLAAAGLLEKACEYFAVYVEHTEQERLEALIEYEARCSQLRGRLRGLLDRIQRGLGITWRYLPAEVKEHDPRLGHESRCPSELMAAERAPDTFVWIDDRFLNAFGYCGGNQIITIYGVLRELRARGVLSDGDFFERLHLLRKADVRHFQVTPEEILHFLGAARVVEREIVETPELMVLRQYVAACLSERGRLQLPPVPEGIPNPHGEVAFLLNVLTAVRESLTKVWSTANNHNLAEVSARADWLLRSLWYETTSLPWLLKQEAQQDDFVLNLLGAALAQLYTEGLSLGRKRIDVDRSGDPPRALYFDWLQLRFGNDPETIEATSRHLAQVFSNSRTHSRHSDEEQNALRAAFGGLLEDLPPSLRSSLRLSKGALARLGIQQYDSVNIEDWSFEAKDFWRAAEKAVRGRISRLTSRKKPRQFSLRYGEEGPNPVIYLSTVDAEHCYAVSDEAFRVLDRSEQVRQAVLRSHQEWFDCFEALFHRHADRIAAIRDSPERIRQVEQWRAGSAAYLYTSLRQKNESGQSVNLSHFEPPPAQRLLNHVRLSEQPADRELPHRLEAAAEVLLRELGFEETFRRLAVFPVCMPKVVQNAYETLSTERQAVWRSEATQNLVSPVARLHLISFFSKADQTSTCDMIESLGGASGQEGFEAFRALLFWTLGRLELRSECSAWSNAALLAAAWIHTGGLYELLAAVSSQQTISQFFSDAALPTSRDVFRSQPELLMDVSHPRRLRLRAFILHGAVVDLNVVKLDDVHRKRIRAFLRALCFDDADGVPLAHPDLLTPADWQRNCLSSFLQGDRGVLLERWLGEDAKYLSTDLIVGLATLSIEALQSSPTEMPTHWQMLTNTLGLCLPPEVVRQPLLALLQNERLSELETLDFEPRRLALYFVMQQAAHFSEATASLEQLLMKLAKRFGEESTDSPAIRKNAALLVECAYILSRRQRTTSDASHEFSRITLEILNYWPGVADEMWALLRGLIASPPAAVLATLWPLLFELRKRARR